MVTATRFWRRRTFHAMPKRLVVSLSDDRAEQDVEGDAANTLQPGVDRRGKRREMRLRDVRGCEGNQRSTE
jgi:hypothetical protein